MSTRNWVIRPHQISNARYGDRPNVGPLKRPIWLRIAHSVGLTVTVFFVVSLAWIMLDSFVPVALTPLMVIRAADSLRNGGSLQFNKEWVPLEEISPNLQAAVLAGEDSRFFEHRGFDFEAIERAMKHNRVLRAQADLSAVGLTRAHRSRLASSSLQGGSTISQQAAKNTFLWPARSWLRKGVEVYFTGLMELLWTKQRILEVYLNVVEWGDGIYGAEAASRYYFHKSASQLSVREAALLAAVLPNPIRFQANHPSGFIRFREGTIEARMPTTYSFLVQAQKR